MMTPEQALADLKGNCDHYVDAPPDCWYCKVAAVITSQQSILKDALRSEQNFQNQLDSARLRLDTCTHLLKCSLEYMKGWELGDLRGIDDWSDKVSDFLRERAVENRND